MNEAGFHLCNTLQVEDKAIIDNSLLDVAVSLTEPGLNEDLRR